MRDKPKLNISLPTIINIGKINYKNRLVIAGIPNEVASLKTGRISDRADQDYIHRDYFEKQMSSALYNPAEKACCSSANIDLEPPILTQEIALNTISGE